MTKVWTARGVALVASVAWAMAGCSSHSPVSSAGTVRTVTTSDVASLAGTWQGSATGATGNATTATLSLNRDGSYSLTAGPWSAQGKAEPRDGGLAFVASGGGTGRGEGAGATGERTGSAVLMDEGDRWALVGSGRGSQGPYNFAFRKPK
jgi:hypothetical protein